MVSASDVETNSSKATQTFVTALVFNLAVGGAELLGFIILKDRFHQIYQPRTYLVPARKRINILPKGLFGWFPAILKTPARDIIQKNGLDAYAYVNFLKMMVFIFVPFFLLSWPVLLPVNAANSGGTNQGLDKYTFGNVGTSKQQQKRYAAHIILVYFFTFYVMYLIKREFAQFVRDRQDFVTSKDHARLPQSRTVLVTGVPASLLNVEALSKFSSYLPGGANRIWIPRDYKDLPDLHDDTNALVLKLEGGVTNLSKTAAKLKLKANKKNKKGTSDQPAEHNEDIAAIESLVPRNKRPTHRLGKIPFIGKKVDTIDYCREQIAKNNAEIAEKRADLNAYKSLGAAFIEFNSQIAAHMFAQSLASELPLRMAARYIEVAPENVIWSNLNINPYQQRIRYVISWAITIATIIFWAFPVAFVGLISNVNSLCATVSWMRWLCNLPVPVNGIIQGVLPPAALAALMMLLPIFLRYLAQFEGIPLRTLIETSLMTRFFIFQVIHGFLIVTLAAGLVAAIPQITQDPSSAVTLLAQKLPQASTFFLTYFVTSSFTGAGGAMLQIVGLVLHYVFLFILGSTPRKVAGITRGMGAVAWGTLFPATTLFTVIGLVYSIIAPIMNGFAAVLFALFYITYKYLFLYVYDMPAAGESGGLFFPLALQHIFVGLYIEGLCLCGLFFLARDNTGGISALPEAILMIVLLVILVLYHSTINRCYWPLVHSLPISLAPKIASFEKHGHEPSSLDEPTISNATTSNGVSSPVKEKHHTPPSPESPQSPATVIEKPDPNGSRESHGAPAYSNHQKDDEEESHDRIHAFNHPCSYKAAQTAWFADDTLGIGRNEAVSCNSNGVSASTEGAVMNEKGKIDIDRAPPGEGEEE